MFCWCYPGALSDNYAISQDPLLKMASKDLVILCLTQDAILSITRQLDSGGVNEDMANYLAF